MLGAWEAAFDEPGFDPGGENWIAEMNEPTRVRIAASLGEDAAAAGIAEGRKLSVDGAVALALGLLR